MEDRKRKLYEAALLAEAKLHHDPLYYAYRLFHRLEEIARKWHKKACEKVENTERIMDELGIGFKK